ncbi:MAG: HAMP domain-containing histidine kinase [Chloroflexaceae bacterium]|nr:HAMP domain-containing histidine kinase [Chloroflexaceae bacterium]
MQPEYQPSPTTTSHHATTYHAFLVANHSHLVTLLVEAITAAEYDSDHTAQKTSRDDLTRDIDATIDALLFELSSRETEALSGDRWYQCLLDVSFDTGIDMFDLLSIYRKELIQVSEPALVQRIPDALPGMIYLIGLCDLVTNSVAQNCLSQRDAFLTMMSDELRNPLHAILGLSEALQDESCGSLNEQQHRALHMIEQSGRRLTRLINDLLDLAYLDAGKEMLRFTPTSVVIVCNGSIRSIQQMALQKGLMISIQIDPALTHVMVLANADRLQQMLVHLLENAIKFTPEGRSIGLEVRPIEDTRNVQFTVWDTGIGIAAEHLTRLFQPFYTIDHRLSRRYRGMGLGLALVQRLATMHGTEVHVTSEPDQGSRFTFTMAVS